MRAGGTPALPIPAETKLIASTSLFNFPPTSTVAEIEDAFSQLPETEFKQVAFVILKRLRKAIQLPPLREFSEAQICGWIKEDERDMSALRVEKY